MFGTLQVAHNKLEVTLKLCTPNKASPDKRQNPTTNDKKSNVETTIKTKTPNTNNNENPNDEPQINKNKNEQTRMPHTFLSNINKTTGLINGNNQQLQHKPCSTN